MLLKHFFVKKIAHSSYILAGKNSCAVIDPQRDIDVYIHEARAQGVEITHILQTHRMLISSPGTWTWQRKPGQRSMWRNPLAVPLTTCPSRKGIP